MQFLEVASAKSANAGVAMVQAATVLRTVKRNLFMLFFLEMVVKSMFYMDDKFEKLVLCYVKVWIGAV